MTANSLSQVPRELAERLFFESILPLIKSGDLDTIQVRAEAVIREAMQLALEHVEKIIRREGIEYEISANACNAAGNTTGGGFDTASSLACRHLLEQVQVLASSPTEQEITK